MFDRKKLITISCTIAASFALLYVSKTLFVSRATSSNLALDLIIPAVGFDESMRVHDYKKVLEHPTLALVYDRFKEQYDKFSPATVKPEATTRIPKKLHQIWLGGNGVLPQEYVAYQESWKKFHPSWEYKLWTERDLATFPFKNKKMFDAATNYGEKSDIWRYEILHQEGGLYIDTDFECLAPFDVFNHTYDLYVGIQPLDTTIVQLGIGLIGARKGHPMLQLAINNLPHQTNKQIVSKTGPLFFTRVFYNAAAGTGMRDIAFPATYFYPQGYNQRSLPANKWLMPESFAVHHWAGSWLKKEAFSTYKK